MELHILTPSQSIEAGSYSYVDSFESIAAPSQPSPSQSAVASCMPGRDTVMLIPASQGKAHEVHPSRTATPLRGP
jgi:hypothetical protein